MVEEGQDVAPFADFTIEDAGGGKEAPKEEAPEKKESEAPAPSETPKPAPTPAEEEAPSGEKLQSALEREPNVSPAAKRLALENGVKLSSVKGSGPRGLITEADIKKAASAGPAPGAAPAAASYTDKETSSMRKVIASRLKESVSTNPHYFVSSSISVTKLLKLRQALNASADGKYKLSLNDFLIKACAVALKKVPAVNSSWQDGFIRQYHNADVSVAVSTPNGLMTPIVKNSGGRGLESISAQVKDMGKRARDGKLAPEEYQGGTFTISNMGMNPAVDRFTAVINPPQAGILAVGTTQKVAVPAESEDGTGVEWDDRIVVTGSFDHKVVDGAVGGEWMREFKKVVESPLELLL